MREMRKSDLGKYNRGTVKIEIKSLIPEKFINLLWKNEVNIKNIAKLDITTMTMDISLKDYRRIENIAKRTETKIKIIDRKGIAFLILKVKRQLTLVGGVVIFIFGLYYLSTFVWNIEIAADRTLTPYEVRQRLSYYGVRPGVPKRKINVYELEHKMISNYDDVMWPRIRIEGSKLKVQIIERIAPPQIITADTPCDLVAKMDGEIERVYTTAGTAVVKRGDIVKAGQILVKGEQGKEGSTYPVHAGGEVIAQTFYEHFKEVQIKGTKNERTGRKFQNTYINILGRKIYLKKTLNKFENYDRIEDNKKLLKKEVFYETKPKEFNLDRGSVVKEVVDAMYTATIESLDKSAKIVDKIENVEPIKDSIRIRVVFVVRQNIGIEQAIQ
jgi:similar to stage IV sporulation protein